MFQCKQKLFIIKQVTDDLYLLGLMCTIFGVPQSHKGALAFLELKIFWEGKIGIWDSEQKVSGTERQSYRNPWARAVSENWQQKLYRGGKISLLPEHV